MKAERLVSDIAFTPAVKAVQEQKGSRNAYARTDWSDRITPRLAAFIAERDSFYLGTASADGQPYIQHRGGPPGFLKVLDDKTLAFADFRGNRQYITAGNLAENPKACIFLMDYASRRRIKIWGKARMVDDDPVLLSRITDSAYKGKPEQAILFTVEAWDVNCRQHITPRFSEREVEATVATLSARIATLEAELARLSDSPVQPHVRDREKEEEK